MRFITLCAILFLVGPSYGEEPNYFLLSYYAGASWDESIAYEDQPGLMKHHAYVRDLHINDLIVMGGQAPEIAGDRLSIMLVRTGSLEEATKIATQDPGVQMRLIRAEVVPWTVTMSSMRFVHRRPRAPILDPDKSFSIKRIDLESQLNIED